MADPKPPFRHLSHAEYSKLTPEAKKKYIDAMLEDAKQRLGQAGDQHAARGGQGKEKKD
jgi:hypothetical protein